MTCWSSLSGGVRHVWPLSLCMSEEDIDPDDWPPSWPKISQTGAGYRAAPLMTAPSLDFGIANPVTTSPQRRQAPIPIPPVPQRPPRPPRSRSASRSRERAPSLKRSMSRSPAPGTPKKGATLKKRMPPSRRPKISAPSEFRKVTGSSEAMIPTRPMPLAHPSPPRSPPPRSPLRARLQMPISRYAMRKRPASYRPVSFHPIELLFLQPGNELPSLPDFSRSSSRRSRISRSSRLLVTESQWIASPMPGASSVPVVSRSTTRSTRRSARRLGRHSSRRSARRHTPTTSPPKMPFSRRSSVSSETSWGSDLESEIDPDFYTPAQQNRRTKAQSFYAQNNPRLTTRLNTQLPMSSSGVNASGGASKELVSPESPNARTSAFHPPSLKLDDLPSAFSSPSTSPTRERSWHPRESQLKQAAASASGVSDADLAVDAVRSTEYSGNGTAAGPDGTLHPPHNHNRHRPRTPSPESRAQNSSTYHAHSPSAGSTASTTATSNTAITNVSNSWSSAMTAAASSPPSPILEPTKHIISAVAAPTNNTTTQRVTMSQTPPRALSQRMSSRLSASHVSPLDAALPPAPLRVPRNNSTTARKNADGRVWREVMWEAQRKEEQRRSRMEEQRRSRLEEHFRRQRMMTTEDHQVQILQQQRRSRLDSRVDRVSPVKEEDEEQEWETIATRYNPAGFGSENSNSGRWVQAQAQAQQRERQRQRSTTQTQAHRTMNDMYESRGESMEVPVGLAIGGMNDSSSSIMHGHGHGHGHGQQDWGKGLGVEFGIAY